MSYDYIFKTVVGGDKGVGKSELYEKYTTNQNLSQYVQTIGCDLNVKTVVVDGKGVKLHHFDSAGDLNDQSKRSFFITQNNPGSRGSFFVYDLTKRSTFENIPTYINEYKETSSKNIESVQVLIGNKSDLESGRQVPREEAEQFAKDNNLLYFEVSAISGDGVKECFDTAIRAMISKFEQPSTTHA
eukprot:gene3202-4010_t